MFDYKFYYNPQFSIFPQLYKNSLMIRRLKWRILSAHWISAEEYRGFIFEG